MDLEAFVPASLLRLAPREPDVDVANLVDRKALPDRVDAPERREERRELFLRDPEDLEVDILRRVAAELEGRGYRHWVEMKLYVVSRQVHFQPPGTSDVQGVWDGQLAMLPIIDVISDVEERVRKLQRRPESLRGRVEHHKYVVRNAPVLAGTRIPTAAVRRFHEAGYSTDQILREYPSLTKEDVDAALKYERGLAKSA